MLIARRSRTLLATAVIAITGIALGQPSPAHAGFLDRSERLSQTHFTVAQTDISLRLVSMHPGDSDGRRTCLYMHDGDDYQIQCWGQRDLPTPGSLDEISPGERTLGAVRYSVAGTDMRVRVYVVPTGNGDTTCIHMSDQADRQVSCFPIAARRGPLAIPHGKSLDGGTLPTTRYVMTGTDSVLRRIIVPIPGGRTAVCMHMHDSGDTMLACDTPSG